MSRVAVMVGALLGLGSTAAAAQSPEFSLPPGRFGVGFRSVDLFDYTRAYREATNATGRPETRERARPIQTSIWYPAAHPGGAPMRFGEYFALGARQDGPPTPAEERRFLARLERDIGMPKARFDSIRSAPTRAFRGAAPAPGKFPVVIYSAGGGQPSWDNSVLFEYLASHGFVVIASPSTWNWERLLPVGDEMPSAEAAARDMEFHLGYSRTLPFVDQSRIGLMGYSWGGLAGPIVASRNSRIATVVNLDGSIKYYYSLYGKATHHDPAQVRAAFFQLSQNWERTKLAGELRGQTVDSAEIKLLSAPFEFYQRLRFTDAYHATMLKFHHGNFASEFTLLDDDRKPGEPTLAEDLEGYRVLERYVLAFLDGYLRGNADSRAWLARSPAANGIPDGVIRLEHQPAAVIPAPTIEGFARFARTNGLARLKGLVDSVRRTDSTYDLSEAMAGGWAELLKQDGDSALGRAVLDWNIERRPTSPGALGALCYWLDAKLERRECFTKLVALDPRNEDAKRELAKAANP